MNFGDSALSSSNAHGSSTSSRPPLTVLFVDPDRQRCERLAQVIRPTCVVGVAPTAKDALDSMRQRVPDLLVTELDLPDLPGAQFIEQVHAAPETRHVLIMVVTSRSSVREKISALTAGADDFLVRPVAPDQFALKVQLLARFRRILGR